MADLSYFDNYTTQPAVTQSAPAAPIGADLSYIENYQASPPVIVTKDKSAPTEEGSFGRNTWTGAARGFGQLMGPAGVAEQLYGQTPFAPAPPTDQATAQQIGQYATNAALMGNSPYVAKTKPGEYYQNAIANTIGSLPQLAFGPGGTTGLIARTLGSFAGSMGGDVGEQALPSYPKTGRVIGTALGSLVGAGSPFTAVDATPGIVPNIGKITDKVSGLSPISKLFGAGGTLATGGETVHALFDNWHEIKDAVANNPELVGIVPLLMAGARGFSRNPIQSSLATATGIPTILSGRSDQ